MALDLNQPAPDQLLAEFVVSPGQPPRRAVAEAQRGVLGVAGVGARGGVDRDRTGELGQGLAVATPDLLPLRLRAEGDVDRLDPEGRSLAAVGEVGHLVVQVADVDQLESGAPRACQVERTHGFSQGSAPAGAGLRGGGNALSMSTSK